MIFRWSDNWRTSTKPEIQQPVFILDKTHTMNDQQVNQWVGLDNISVDMHCAYTGQSRIFPAGKGFPSPLRVSWIGRLGWSDTSTHCVQGIPIWENPSIFIGSQNYSPKFNPIKFVSASANRPFFPWQLFHFEVNISFFPVKFQSLALHLKDIIRR